MEVKLKNKKLTTIGGSQGFIVDKAFIDNGQLEKDKEYDLIIVPSQSINDKIPTKKVDEDGRIR